MNKLYTITTLARGKGRIKEKKSRDERKREVVREKVNKRVCVKEIR